MQRIAVGGFELAYEEAGAGEPLLLIHGGFIADTFAALMPEPSLAPFRRIRYHRRALGESGTPGEQGSIAAYAADACGLLDALGIARAHVAGHSFGGTVALQMAVDAPERVHTLTVLEPALLIALPSGAQTTEAMMPVVGAYLEQDHETAVARFMTLIAGPEFRSRIDKALGSAALAQAVADCDTVFQDEFVALQAWTFGPDLAVRLTMPVLSVLGSESDAVIGASGAPPFFGEGAAALRSWIPHLEEATIAGLDHLLFVEDPSAVGKEMAAFLARHPM